jgi:hypothetical protein
MIEIKIDKYNSPIHCVKCGVQTTPSVINLTSEGAITVCPHFIYLGNGTSPFDLNTKDMFCKFFDELDQIGGDFLQLLRENVDDEHLLLNIESPVVPLERYFLVYNLGDLSKEKKYFNGDEDCPYWNVWGPTIEAVERRMERQ